jgi:hypothetical protein
MSTPSFGFNIRHHNSITSLLEPHSFVFKSFSRGSGDFVRTFYVPFAEDTAILLKWINVVLLMPECVALPTP